MDKIWILTEERPKPSVIMQIIKLYCNDFNDAFSITGEIKIRPIIQDGYFTFLYIVEGVNIAGVQDIVIKTVSGYSSFLDFLLFKQENEPIENDNSQIPLMGIEETKTNDDESRNTGVSQRVSKFVYFNYFYPSAKRYMLYNDELEARENKKPSNTNIFGTNILLSLGVTIVGKDISWFSPFSSLDEMIAFKQNMKSPPKGNVPIQIEKNGNTITISGRLSKPADAGNIAYDPNIGALSMIGAGLRHFGWSGNIVLTHHNVAQSYVDKNTDNKMLYNCKLLGMALDGITMPQINLPNYYWHYEKKSEKMADILLHVQCMYHGMNCVYENHAGCERGYFRNKEGQLITIKKRDAQNNKLNIPDVVLYDDITNCVLLIEGKMLSTLRKGLEEIELYDSIEQEYISPNYANAQIIRWLSIFGGNKDSIPHEKVLFYLAENGHIIINQNAPDCIRRCFSESGCI